MIYAYAACLVFLSSATAYAQQNTAPEKLTFSGYAQVRYDRIPTFDHNDAFVNMQGDRQLSNPGGFSLRRARLSVVGNLHPRLQTVVQVDFASLVNESSNIATLRDVFADVFLFSDRTLRLRIGQAKIPFGFENMQSSGFRAALDRADGLNSGLKDERDLGVFLYWSPSEQQALFKEMNTNRNKGGGDFGVIGAGVYNGQGMNQFEANKVPHAVLHGAWPFRVGSQLLEVGGGAYAGMYRMKTQTPGTASEITLTGNTTNRLDARGYLSFYMAPKPFGIQAEYNVGTGPVMQQRDLTRVRNAFLHGGYLQCLYTFSSSIEYLGDISPFTRISYYKGGRKHEPNSPEYTVKELALGVEWVPFAQLRTTLEYDIGQRNQPTYPYTQQSGHNARIQAQFSF